MTDRKGALRPMAPGAIDGPYLREPRLLLAERLVVWLAWALTISAVVGFVSSCFGVDVVEVIASWTA